GALCRPSRRVPRRRGGRRRREGPGFPVGGLGRAGTRTVAPAYRRNYNARQPRRPIAAPASVFRHSDAVVIDINASYDRRQRSCRVALNLPWGRVEPGRRVLYHFVSSYGGSRMPTPAKVRKWGSSLAVLIPSQFAKMREIDIGT